MIKLRLVDSSKVIPEIEGKMDMYGWFPLGRHAKWSPADFELCHVLIDGRVYTEDTANYRDAYDKAIIWHRLSK